MDPLKIVIFVAAFLLLLLLGRKLSSASEVHAYQPPPEPAPAMPVALSQIVEEAPAGGAKPPAVTGAELPFPVKLPELVMDEDGRYNRPEFLNYHFDKIDLVQGPSDPAAFVDNFYMETRDPGHDREALYAFVIGTPAGFERVLSNEHLPSLYVDDLIIVPRWDLTAILKATAEQIIKLYRENQDMPEESAETQS